MCSLDTCAAGITFFSESRGAARSGRRDRCGAGTGSLEAIAWVRDTDGHNVLWYNDGLDLVAIKRSLTTYEWSRVDEISSVLMTDVYCDACDALTSNVADLDAVDRTLFILIDDAPARVLVSIDVDTGTKVAEHRLPGDHDEWEGIDLVSDASRPGEFDVYLARDHPPEIWHLRYSLVDGFLCAA